MSRLISQYFCNLNSPKNFTCPLGKLITEFTSLTAKSTSPRLSDTTFSARCVVTMYIIIFLFLHYLKLAHNIYYYFILITFVIYFLFVFAFPLEILALVDTIFWNSKWNKVFDWLIDWFRGKLSHTSIIITLLQAGINLIHNITLV